MKTQILLLTTAVCILFSCTKSSENKNEDPVLFAEQQLEYALECVDKAMEETTKEGMVCPRTIEKDGSLRLIGARDWCSGFFPGTLWRMYEFTNDTKWKELAEEYSLRIEEEKFDTSSHDIGFKMFCSFGNGYRLTQNKTYKEILLQAAETLTKRYNPQIGSIRGH